MHDVTPPAIAQRPAIIGLVLGVLSALSAVLWPVAIPIGVVAVILGWWAARAAHGRDSRTTGFAIGALVCGAFGIVLGGATVLLTDDDSGADPNPPTADLVEPLSYNIDLDGLQCGGQVTNHTDRPARYVIKVVWDNEGARLAEATALLESVEPGATAPFNVDSRTRGTAATTCRVDDIEREPA